MGGDSALIRQEAGEDGASAGPRVGMRWKTREPGAHLYPHTDRVRRHRRDTGRWARWGGRQSLDRARATTMMIMGPQ